MSVIIPTYNRERFVTEAIDSVLDQTVTDYEILVIDDGSTDGTRKALEAYVDKIKYIYQENSGVSSARNVGIKEAQGEWVAFLDSDDEWTTDYLSTQMAQLEKFPRAVAHITNASTVYLHGQSNNHFDETKFSSAFGQEECVVIEKPFRFIIEHSPWFLQSSLMRRDLLLQTGLFDTRLSIAEDLDMIAEMALKGPFSFSRKVCVKIYRRQESIENLSSQSVKKGIYACQAFGRVYSELLNRRELASAEKAAVAKVLSSNWRAMGNLLLKTGKKTDARYYYKKSLFLYPSGRSLIKYLATFLQQRLSVLFIRKGEHILPGDDV